MPTFLDTSTYKRSSSTVFQIFLMSMLALLLSACNTIKTVAPVEPILEPPTIALVLGGGGAKGFAHIGVIKVLEKNGITPNLIVGTSVGSLVGSLYASGLSATELEQLALTTSDSELTDFTLSSQGFIKGIKLKNFVNTQVESRPIEDFPIRFAAVAAEQSSLKKAVFTTGNAGLAVQASSSVPNIFIAPRVPEGDGKRYVDGGVVSLIPVDTARDLGVDLIIAVDVMAPSSAQSSSQNSVQGGAQSNTPITITSLSSLWGLIENNLANSVSSSARNRSSSMRVERDRADIIITPDVGHLSSIDTSQRRALIAAGEQSATVQIKAIKQLITDNTKVK